MKRDIIGLVDCHNCPEMGSLTANRALASTSFLGRYAFADFALSNFCNSEINDVCVLVKDHERSILKHLGNMTSWLTNTKIGREQILYNERGILNPPFNHDINNIRENDWVLYSSNASYLVFMAPHIVLDIDLRPIIAEHIARKEKMTMVYKPLEDADIEFRSEDLLEIDEEGYVTSISKNDGTKKKANASLAIWIVNRTILADIIKRHGAVNPLYGMKEMIPYLLRVAPFKIHSYKFEGYARCFDSFAHYIEYSFELLNAGVAKELFNPDWPIFTLTHDTPPALYGKDSKVVNSFISNGCVVEGEVENSIICRNVKIGRNTKITDSIILSNVAIGDETIVKNVVIDKYSVITSRQKVEGKPDEFVYLKQGVII